MCSSGVLSSLSVTDFKGALQNHDMLTLTSAPGVGKKMAERLFFELKDKIGDVAAEQGFRADTHASSADQESVRALVSLGYKHLRAQQMVQSVMRETDAKTVEDIIRQALKRM